MIIFITDMNQVRTITNTFIPLQSGSVFLQAPQADRCVISAQICINMLDGNHRVIFTWNDRITIN